MNERVTLASIAEATGVSVMTVSNVLNGRPGASPATRRRVAKVAQELGYIPSAAARNLKGGRTGLIGVLADIEPYALEVVRGIVDELDSTEYELLISASHHGTGREHDRIEFLTRGVVDGVVLLAPALEERTVELLATRGGAVVIVDPRKFDIPLPRVVVDNYEGMRRATEHLTALGHTRIGYLSGVWHFDSSRARHSGYADAMRLAGLRVPPELTAVCDFTYASGFASAATMLETERPTAILAGADVLALGAMDAARSKGLSVPRDVSIVGFDDLPEASRSYPGLTTVRQPLHDMGQLAARSVLSQLSGTGPLMERMLFSTSLIIRGSTAHARTPGQADIIDTVVSE